MKEVFLAHWVGDTSPEFASETFEKLLPIIDEFYGNKGTRGKLQRDISEFETCLYGTIEYEYFYKGEKEKDLIKILHYYIL